MLSYSIWNVITFGTIKFQQLNCQIAEEEIGSVESSVQHSVSQYYPLAVYEGETSDPANESTYPKVFPEPLTVDLLQQHQELSEQCKDK